jgi:hypothetical protein
MSAYRVAASVVAKVAIQVIGEDFLNILRSPLLIVLDPAISPKGAQEQIRKGRNCLVDRNSGNCVN